MYYSNFNVHLEIVTILTQRFKTQLKLLNIVQILYTEQRKYVSQVYNQ